jgi:uncharacterized protein (TIGR04255 family)
MPDSIRRPHFARPPVIEVACGVQFEELEQWRTTHYGQFGTAIRDAYPETEDHPPLARVRLEAPTTFGPLWVSLPPLRRVFFISPPGNFLIQLQPNRLLHNWRKVAEGDEYPRFDAAFEKFAWTWEQFNRYLSVAGLPRPKAEIWELTYINHIVGEDARFPQKMWDYLGFYGTHPEATTSKEASSMAMQIAWPIPDGMGTLLLDVKHGNRVNDQKEVLVLEFTVRGPASDDPTDMNTWFGVAHHAIVNSFEKLTTARAHRVWEIL